MYHPRCQWGVPRMDLLNYCKKHRRKKCQLSSQPETSSSCVPELQTFNNLSSCQTHSIMHVCLTLVTPALGTALQVCPTLLSKGQAPSPAHGWCSTWCSLVPRGRCWFIVTSCPRTLRPFPARLLPSWAVPARPGAGHGPSQRLEGVELHENLGLFPLGWWVPSKW